MLLDQSVNFNPINLFKFFFWNDLKQQHILMSLLATRPRSMEVQDAFITKTFIHKIPKSIFSLFLCQGRLSILELCMSQCIFNPVTCKFEMTFGAMIEYHSKCWSIVLQKYCFIGKITLKVHQFLRLKIQEPSPSFPSPFLYIHEFVMDWSNCGIGTCKGYYLL